MHYFNAAMQTSAPKLALIFQKLKITFLALTVNEVKVTWTKAFIDHIFALESEEESKSHQRTLFWDCLQILDLSLNPQTGTTTYMVFYQLF